MTTLMQFLGHLPATLQEDKPLATWLILIKLCWARLMEQSSNARMWTAQRSSLLKRIFTSIWWLCTLVSWALNADVWILILSGASCAHCHSKKEKTLKIIEGTVRQEQRLLLTITSRALIVKLQLLSPWITGAKRWWTSQLSLTTATRDPRRWRWTLAMKKKKGPHSQLKLVSHRRTPLLPRGFQLQLTSPHQSQMKVKKSQMMRSLSPCQFPRRCLLLNLELRQD